MSFNICPHCSFANKENVMWCGKCKKIIPISTDNFFIILNLPQQLNLDLQALEQTFFMQLKQTHPDRFISHNEAEVEVALKNSFLINQAYKSLKSPYLRLEHLLKINGLNIDEQLEVKDPAFLEETFIWREELAEAKSQKEIRQIISTIQKIEKEEFSEAARLITEKLYSQALEVYIKLKFLKRFLTEAQVLENDHEAV